MPRTSIGEMIRMEEYLQDQVDPAPTAGQQYRDRMWQQQVQQQRGAGKALWDTRGELATKMHGAALERTTDEWRTEISQIKDPWMQKYAQTKMKGTLVDPQAKARYDYRKNNPYPELTDTMQMSDVGSLQAEANDMLRIHQWQQGDMASVGIKKPDLPPLSPLSDGKWLQYKDGEAKIVDDKYLNFDELREITGSKDTDAVIAANDGYATYGSTTQVKLADGQTYTHQMKQSFDGRKGFDLTRLGGTPGTGGAGAGGGAASTKAGQKIDANLNGLLLAYAANDSSPDTAVLEGIPEAGRKMGAGLIAQFEELEGVPGSEGIKQLPKSGDARYRMLDDVFQGYIMNSIPGHIGVITDGKKLQDVGGWTHDNTIYAPNSKWGVMRIQRGRWLTARTKDGKLVKFGYRAGDGMLMDSDLQEMDRFPSDLAARAWVAEQNFTDFEGGTMRAPQKNVTVPTMTISQATSMIHGILLDRGESRYGKDIMKALKRRGKGKKVTRPQLARALKDLGYPNLDQLELEMQYEFPL